MPSDADLSERMRAAFAWQPDLERAVIDVERRVRRRTQRTRAVVGGALAVLVLAATFVLLPGDGDEDASVVVGPPDTVPIDEHDLLGELDVTIVDLVGSLNKETLLSVASMEVENEDAELRAQLDAQRAETDRLTEELLPGLEERVEAFGASQTEQERAFIAVVESAGGRLAGLRTSRRSVDQLEVEPRNTGESLTAMARAATVLFEYSRTDDLHRRDHLEVAALLLEQVEQVRLWVEPGWEEPTQYVLANLEVSRGAIGILARSTVHQRWEQLPRPSESADPPALLDQRVTYLEASTALARDVAREGPRSAAASSAPDARLLGVVVELHGELGREAVLHAAQASMSGDAGREVSELLTAQLRVTDDAIDAFEEAMADAPTTRLSGELAAVHDTLDALVPLRSSSSRVPAVSDTHARYEAALDALESLLRSQTIDGEYMHAGALDLWLLTLYESSTVDVAVALAQVQPLPTLEELHNVIELRNVRLSAIEQRATATTKQRLRRAATSEAEMNHLLQQHLTALEAGTFRPAPSLIGLDQLDALSEVIGDVLADVTDGADSNARPRMEPEEVQATR